MRGNRVRNIVNELQGEKIDIVRYNEDIKEYIKAALSPAEVSEIKLDKEAQKATVIVSDDQLSLSIGKHGQNVRLASKLIGWELDIRTKTMIAEAEARREAEAAAQAAVAAEKERAPAAAQEEKKEKKEKKAKKEKKIKKQKAALLEKLPGVGEKTLEALKAAGFKNAGDSARAKPEDLTQVKGIGEKKAEKLIAQAKKVAKG
jgi:N utilization substance protein A